MLLVVDGLDHQPSFLIGPVSDKVEIAVTLKRIQPSIAVHDLEIATQYFLTSFALLGKREGLVI